MNGIMRSFMCTFLSPTRSSSDEKQKVSENKRKKSESLSPPKAKAARHRSVSSSSAHRYDGDDENIYFIENLHSVYPLNGDYCYCWSRLWPLYSILLRQPDGPQCVSPLLRGENTARLFLTEGVSKSTK